MDLFLTVLHILTCLMLVVVILLQQGRGADIGAVFGGSSSTIFGSSGAGNFLTKVTSALAAVFMLSALALTYLSGRHLTASVFDEGLPPPPVEVEEPGAPGPEAAVKGTEGEAPVPAAGSEVGATVPETGGGSGEASARAGAETGSTESAAPAEPGGSASGQPSVPSGTTVGSAASATSEATSSPGGMAAGGERSGATAPSESASAGAFPEPLKPAGSSGELEKPPGGQEVSGSARAASGGRGEPAANP